MLCQQSSLGVDNLCLLFLATGKQQPCSKTIYHICSIRRHGYYLFHRAILCSFYSRAATNPEWRLFNSVFSIKSFVFARALRKASFIRLTKNCNAVIWFWNKHSSTMIALHAWKLLWTACVFVPIVYTLAIRGTRLFTCACATWILAVASIWERRLFRSSCPEVWQQFESGD